MCVTAADSNTLSAFCYGDEENARIYAVHLTTANQSEIRRAYLVSVYNEKNARIYAVHLTTANQRENEE